MNCDRAAVECPAKNLIGQDRPTDARKEKAEPQISNLKHYYKRGSQGKSAKLAASTQRAETEKPEWKAPAR